MMAMTKDGGGVGHQVNGTLLNPHSSISLVSLLSSALLLFFSLFFWLSREGFWVMRMVLLGFWVRD